MTQFMPHSDFKWLEQSEYDKINWKNINSTGDTGYILEVDLDYPKEIYLDHKDYPLAPEKRKINLCDLSEYQKNTLELLKKIGHKRVASEKLMLTFIDKKNYILHFRNLKLYLFLGLKLRKIHRVLSFKQSQWLKNYVDFNTNLRANVNSDFEKDLYKLMNNSVFGKSIQNSRKHLNVKLALTENQTRRWISMPHFQQFKIIDENKAIIKLRQTFVKLDKPIYIGFSVLELSKLHMYDLHYNVFKSYYGHNIKLVYTDTDSFLYEINTNDLYEDFSEMFSEYMDFSNYPEDHHLKNNKNKKKIGYLKDEYGGEIITQFVGIKSKLYSILYGGDKNKTTAKGLNKSVLQNFITHNHYKNVIEKNNLYVTKMRRILSSDHKLGTYELKKLIFTPMDDKRYILKNGIDTLPFGFKI
jgi:hypothetical protein